MKLKQILNGLEGLKVRGNLEVDIENVENDSRKIKENGMFVAIKGFDVDGHEFIKQAIDNGAKAIVIEEGTKLKKLIDNTYYTC